MSKRRFQLLLAACLVAGTLSAANDPFVGKWKLNPSESKVIDYMKVNSLGGNKYALDLGAGYIETIVADGTDQPGVQGTTLSVAVEGPMNWKVVRKKDSRLLLTGIWKLSEDGKTLTDHYSEYQPNGSKSFSQVYVYERRAGNAGFTGTWVSTSQPQSASELQIQSYEGDGLSFIQHATQNVKFDGKDYPVLGPGVPPGYTSSGRRVNERTLEITDKFKGKVRDTQQIELSTDLKTLTRTVQSVGQSEPNIFVFDRE